MTEKQVYSLHGIGGVSPELQLREMRRQRDAEQARGALAFVVVRAQLEARLRALPAGCEAALLTIEDAGALEPAAKVEALPTWAADARGPLA